MRIVNIGICVLLAIMAVLPLWGVGGFTLSAAGRAAATIVIALATGVVFAAVAWFASGREEPAREAGFGIGVVLIIMLLLTPVFGLGPKLPMPKPKTAGIDAVASPDTYLQNHPFAKADPESDKGRAYAALTVFFEDVRQRVYEFDRAANQALAFDLVRVARAISVEELRQAQAGAERYAEAAKNQREFLKNIERHLDNHLRARGVDFKMRQRMLSDFKAGREPRSVEAMKTHELLAAHIKTLLSILIDEWGKWTIDESQRWFVFQDKEMSESFNKLADLIRDCERMLKSPVQNAANPPPG